MLAARLVRGREVLRSVAGPVPVVPPVQDVSSGSGGDFSS